MNGSEKQIKWAEQIKASFMADLKNNFFAKLVRVGENKINSGSLTREALTSVVEIFEKAFDGAIKNESALFWIENRNRMGIEMLFAFLPEEYRLHNVGMILDRDKL